MSLDDLTGSEVSISYDQERIHSGRSYVATYKVPDASPLADNADIDFLIINGEKAIHLIFTFSGNSDVEIQFYENPVVSGTGTQVPIVGLNRFRTLPQHAVVYRDPAVTSVGDLLYNDYRAYGVGAEFSHTLEWILRPNTSYMVRGINRAGSAQSVYMMIHWDEYQ